MVKMFKQFDVALQLLFLYLSSTFIVKNHLNRRFSVLKSKDASDIGQLATSFISFIDRDKDCFKTLASFREKVVSPLADH